MCTLLLTFALFAGGCGKAAPGIESSPLGYTASLSEADAKALVVAGRDQDAILEVFNRIVPSPSWSKTLTKLILDRNEQFKKEVEAKNGPAVDIEVLGVKPEAGNPVFNWFESEVAKATLPDEWRQRNEFQRAASTVALYWTVNAR